MRFQTENGVLIAQANGETLRIEPWGKDSLRVRATMLPEFSGKDWALTEEPEKTEAKAEQFEVDHLEIDGSMGKRTSASITNGKIRAVVNFAGVITFYKEDQEILREYHRCYDGTISKESRCLKTVNREWKGVIGGSEYLVAPIFHLNEFEREVYLPAGRWEDTRDGKVYEGGQTVLAAAPINSIPVFKKIA